MKLIILTILAVAMATANASTNAKIADGIGFMFCDAIRDNLPAILQSGVTFTEEQADTYADAFCSVLNEDQEKSCIDTINAGIKYFIKAYTAGEVPSDICEQMSVCSEDSIMLQLDQMFCEAVFANGGALKAASTSETETQMNTYLDMLCLAMKEDRQQSCVDSINNVIHFFAGKIAEGSDGSEVCGAITDCSDDA